MPIQVPKPDAETRARDLVKHLGKPSHCRKCGGSVTACWHWRDDKFVDYNSDGTLHEITCSRRAGGR